MKVYVALLAFIALLSSVVGQTTTCTQPRVRRPWSSYTASDKDLYREALNLAMTRGLHHKFVEVHLNPASEHEAHDCLFFHWHRRFLVAYENMLRSLGTKFSCVTLPYWDFWKLNSQYQAQRCVNVTNCNTLPTDLGATTATNNFNGPFSDSWYNVVDKSDNGWFPAATCYRNGNPATSGFCQSQQDFDNKTCYGCIPRNDLTQASVPAMDLLYNQVFAATAAQDSFNRVTRGVQYNYHNVIHATLSAVMGTFASPSDPMFYIHHATVDALHAIYHQCVVRPVLPLRDPLNRLQWPTVSEWRPPANSTTPPRSPQCWRSFRNVTLPNGGFRFEYEDYAPNQTVRMDVMAANDRTYSLYVDVLAADSPLRPYFASITSTSGTILRTYGDFYDGNNLGSSSYTYNFGSTTYGLGRLNAQCRRTVSSSASVTLLEGETDPDEVAAIKQQLFQNDLYKFFKDKGVSPADITTQIGLARCLYTNECLNGAFDYSDEFRKRFHVHGSPKCYQLIEQYVGGELDLPDGWRERYEKHYTCNSGTTAF